VTDDQPRGRSAVDAARAVEMARVRAVAKAFAAAGFDVFATTRQELDRVDALEQALKDRQHAAEDHEQAIAQRLADGGLDVDGAAHELAAVAVPGLDVVAERAMSVLRRRVDTEAARSALSAFHGLVGPVAEAVKNAVAAGRRCCDVDAVAKAFRGPEYRMLVPPLVADASTRPDWSAAVTASQRVKEFRKLADMLTAIGGPSPRFWAKRPIGEPGLVGDLVPEPLVLAVGEAIGWQPALVAGGPVAPSPFDDAGQAAAQAEVLRRAPVLGALRQRIDEVAAGLR